MTEVRGQADPAIIRYFLEQPSGAEIITSDDFRNGVTGQSSQICGSGGPGAGGASISPPTIRSAGPPLNQRPS